MIKELAAFKTFTKGIFRVLRLLLLPVGNLVIYHTTLL